jgi:hypothetical protein
MGALRVGGGDALSASMAAVGGMSCEEGTFTDGRSEKVALQQGSDAEKGFSTSTCFCFQESILMGADACLAVVAGFDHRGANTSPWL